MDEIILFLFKKRAHKHPVQVTTRDIGESLGMSQQNASRRLRELEDCGYVERKSTGVRLTNCAYEGLLDIYSILRQGIEGSKTEFHGTIVDGVGEGRYYLSLKGYREQIKERFGFLPYPGTLNIRLYEKDQWKRNHLLDSGIVLIHGFKDNARTYGDIYARECKLEGQKAAIIFPMRTHHGNDVLEIIGPRNFRKKLKKKSGDKTKVSV